MYLDLYGLKKSPFNITSDPYFFFESTSHKEASAALLYGIQEKKGIILITGEVGTGKTTLCKSLLNILTSDIRTSFILNPYRLSRRRSVRRVRSLEDDQGPCDHSGSG